MSPIVYYIWKLYPSGRYEPYTLVTSVPVDLLDLLNCCTAIHVLSYIVVVATVLKNGKWTTLY